MKKYNYESRNESREPVYDFEKKEIAVDEDTDEEIGDCIDYALADDISEIEEIIENLKYTRQRLEKMVILGCRDLTKVGDYRCAMGLVGSLKHLQIALKEKLGEMQDRTDNLYDLFLMQIDCFFEAEDEQEGIDSGVD